MKLVTWNVNSLKARKEHVLRFLKETAPDVLMVQELKGLDFPHEEFLEAGYHTEAVTQKTYNGVAVFTKEPITVLHTALPGDESDEQSRFIEFETGCGLRCINIYLPNGNPRPGDKYDYKLRWMERLYVHLKALREQHIPFLIGGDFNVIPEGKDCHNPTLWSDDALFTLETRQAWRKLLHLGLTDALRACTSTAETYTFWDYQRGAWQKNHGIRIDHFLLSPSIADRLVNCYVDTAPRGWEKPSDHTPVILEIQ